MGVGQLSFGPFCVRYWMWMEPADPKSVKVNVTSGSGMDIEWKDGHLSSYSFPFLRDACPCALCNEERERDGRQPGDPLKAVGGALPMYKAAARPTEVEAGRQVRDQLSLERRPRARHLLLGVLAQVCPCTECKARRAMEAPSVAVNRTNHRRQERFAADLERRCRLLLTARRSCTDIY